MKNNDELEEYYRENYGGLCKSIGRLAGSPENAEDVVQEAFCRALQYWGSYDTSKGKLNSWFTTIMHRTLKDFMRAERNSGMNLDDVEQETEACEETRYLRREGYKEVLAAIEAKPRPTKDILWLYFFKNYVPKDIVQILDVKPTNVMQTVWRFKRDMGEKLGESI